MWSLTHWTTREIPGNRFLRETGPPLPDSSCKQFQPVLQRATKHQVPGDTAVNGEDQASIPAGVRIKSWRQTTVRKYAPLVHMLTQGNSDGVSGRRILS